MSTAVIDTNILVSALLKSAGNEALLPSEYRDTLARPKFQFLPRTVQSLLETIQARGRLVHPGSYTKHLPLTRYGRTRVIRTAELLAHLTNPPPVNYRHAFHAGNFADCMKHATLLAIFTRLTRKPAPLFVLDTHAGRGHYDLLAEAQRTGEWRDGIARLIPPPKPLAPYVHLVERLGLYPGSPALIRATLRPHDALACCELHPEDAAALRRHFRQDPQTAIHHRDGYEAIAALLPPKQARGLILIDPPYEQPEEFGRVIKALQTGATRFNQATYVAWYPIKHRSPITEFHATLQQTALPDIIAAELTIREPTDPTRLNGCGLIIRNPPYGLEAEPILHSLRQTLGEPGATAAITRLNPE